MYPMSNIQINSILSRHYHTSHYYGGCYSADTLPLKVFKYPSFLIVNASSSSEICGHWLFFGFPAKRADSEFFDSLGESPSSYSRSFHDFLINNGSGKYVSNTRRYQDDNSVTCGHFCLYVADKRCQNIPLPGCFSRFDPAEWAINEAIVTNYVSQHMSLTSPNNGTRLGIN